MWEEMIAGRAEVNAFNTARQALTALERSMHHRGEAHTRAQRMRMRRDRRVQDARTRAFGH